MQCKKCKSPVVDKWVACPFCGVSLKKKPAEKRAVRHGNGMGGVIKTENGKYMARVTVGWTPDHKPIRKTKSGFKTKAEAFQYVAILKETPHAVRGSISLRQLYEKWEPFYEPRISDMTMKTYISAFKYFQPIEHLKLEDITVEELQDCIDKAVAAGKGRSTINNMKTVCSLLYDFAEMKNLCDKNPASHLYVSAVKKGTREPITEAQLEIIRQAVGVEPYADYVYCLCYLGYRPGEMLEMKKSSYNAEEHYFVGGKKTEAGKNRIVTISPKIQPIIDRLIAEMPGEYVFPRQDGKNLGKKMSDEHFNKTVFKPLMRKLGLDDTLSPYSARHTFANKLKKVTGSDTDKASLIGHADASMTKYYQAADIDSLKQITNSL